MKGHNLVKTNGTNCPIECAVISSLIYINPHIRRSCLTQRLSTFHAGVIHLVEHIFLMDS
jgi:hypothetical protein